MEAPADLDFMFCERMKCRLKKSVCLARQGLKDWKGAPRHLECVDCPQGLENRKNAVMEDLPGATRPAGEHGPESRRSRKSHVKKELGGRMMSETRQLCSQCGTRPAMVRENGQVINGKCNQCMGRLLRAKKKSTEASRVRLDFSGDPDLLARVREIADREYRTVEAQLLYTVKKGLQDF
jgi:hypothetical protein